VCKTDKIDARVLAVLSERDLVPEIWLPDTRVRREREEARGGRQELTAALPDGSGRRVSLPPALPARSQFVEGVA
jgi:hypothetical protein